MADVSVADRDAALRLLFGGTLYLGLARDNPEDEETDAGYRRRAVTLSAPQGDGVRYVTNTDPILFPEYRRDAQKPVRFAFLSASQQGGEIKWSDKLALPEQLKAGGILFFAAGKLRIGIA